VIDPGYLHEVAKVLAFGLGLIGGLLLGGDW
jgi:hypothetical protein